MRKEFSKLRRCFFPQRFLRIGIKQSNFLLKIRIHIPMIHSVSFGNRNSALSNSFNACKTFNINFVHWTRVAFQFAILIIHPNRISEMGCRLVPFINDFHLFEKRPHGIIDFVSELFANAQVITERCG